MGLLTSVNNLSYTLEEEKKNKKIEQIKKQKEKLRKENLNRYKKDLEKYMSSEFNKYFELAGSSYIYEFYNKTRKQEILNNFYDTISINEQGFIKIPFKNELEEHFYNKYTTILNKCLKEQKQQEIYNTTVEAKKIEVIEEEEKKNNNILPIFLAILLTICKIGLFIVFAPIILILMILFAAIKAM